MLSIFKYITSHSVGIIFKVVLDKFTHFSIILSDTKRSFLTPGSDSEVTSGGNLN